MTVADERPTLCLTATFPPNRDFAPTVGELTSRLAVSAGMGEDEATEVGRSMETAFLKAVNGHRVEDAPPIEVSLCAGETALDLSVSCGSNSFLALGFPRPK
ncbi:MAG: hypothetical protein NTV05_09460 [Acidobacteria bacterium]|nr:hypothetical protein [Acidobacteriota bacterium]